MVVMEMLLLLLLSTAAAGVDVDLSGFSSKLQQLTDEQLGIEQFQEFLDGQKETRLSFLKWSPDGRGLAEKIALDIDDQIKLYKDAVRRIQTAYNGGRIGLDTEIRLGSCCNISNLVDDQRFLQPIDDKTVCHLTPSDMSIDVAVKNAMIYNLAQLPSSKWQFYGTEDRRHCTYPARIICKEVAQFDPRVRPWYTTTLNTPRDIVILIDRSRSMGDPYVSGVTKFAVAKKAAAALVQYLNANDRVAVLAFSNAALYANSTGCFSTELAVGTDDNKNKLLNFINFGFGVETGDIRAEFKVAFQSAKDLFVATDGKTGGGLYVGSAKIIVLLTDANQKEDCQQLPQLELDLFNNTVNIFTMGIGDSVKNDPQKVSCLKALTAGPRGAQGFVPVSDDFSDLRSKLDFYYNAFINGSDRDSVTFSPPFTDVSGLGLQTAACLPLFRFDGNVSGVTCVQMSVDEVFSDVVNFRLGQFSYGFVIDGRGRVILHHLLPTPTYWLEQPTLLELTTVEISDYALNIEQQILSGQPGNRTVNSVKCYTAAGQSDLQGVTKFDKKATYYWHPIPSMNFYVGLVIIDNELKSNLTWNSVFNDVFLSDELDSTNITGSCVFFNRSSLTERSVVKLAPKAFLYPSNYTERSVSPSDLYQLKSYLTVKGEQSPYLAIKTGIRDVVAATSQLDLTWLRKTGDDVQRQNILSRYIGTKEGVYRRHPVVRIDKDFDPTIQPWYKTASVQQNQISFTLPFLDFASSVPTISISKIIWSKGERTASSSGTVMGVLGMDVTAKYLHRLLVENIAQCSQSGQECFAIDVSGFLVIYKDFGSTFPTGSLHIAAREQAIASELIRNKILMADTCINYVSLPITRRLFWNTDMSGCLQLQTCIICKLKYGSDFGTNLFLIVKLPPAFSSSDKCACQNQTDGKYGCAYDLTSSVNQCQCPCNLAVEYDSCLTDLHIDPVTWKPCIPSATLLNQADVTLQKSLSNLPSCLDCSSFTDPLLCQANNCYWLSQTCTAKTAATPTPASSSSPDPDNSTSADSSRSLTLGLAIGLPVGIAVLATVVGCVLFCRHSRRHPASKVKTYNDLYEATGGYVTTIVVSDRVEPPMFGNANEGYLETDKNPGDAQMQNSSSLASVV